MRFSAVDDAVHAAAARRVDERVDRRREDVAGGDDVRPPEEDDAVAVGVGGGLMDDLHRFAVEEQLLVALEVGVGRPQPRRPGIRSGRDHPVEHVLVRDDGGLRAGVAAETGFDRRAIGPGRTGLGKVLVAADVVVVHVGVDDVVNRLGRERPDRGEQLGAELRAAACPRPARRRRPPARWCCRRRRRACRRCPGRAAPASAPHRGSAPRHLAPEPAGLAGDPRREAAASSAETAAVASVVDRGLHRGACFILSMNSGYMVSAPPSMAMSGSLKRSLNSL